LLIRFINLPLKGYLPTHGKIIAKFTKFEIVGDDTIINYLGPNLVHAISQINDIGVEPANNDGQNGLVAVDLQIPNGLSESTSCTLLLILKKCLAID